jgi:hypothetical protein
MSRDLCTGRLICIKLVWWQVNFDQNIKTCQRITLKEFCLVATTAVFCKTKLRSQHSMRLLIFSQLDDFDIISALKVGSGMTILFYRR